MSGDGSPGGDALDRRSSGTGFLPLRVQFAARWRCSGTALRSRSLERWPGCRSARCGGPRASSRASRSSLRRRGCGSRTRSFGTSCTRDLAPEDRDRLHGQAAALLEAARAAPERVAAQLLAVDPAGDERVCVTLRRAAGVALSAGAGHSAVAYLRRALAEPCPEDVRAELLVELGAAERLVDGRAALAHLRDALDLTTDARPLRRDRHSARLASDVRRAYRGGCDDGGLGALRGLVIRSAICAGAWRRRSLSPATTIRRWPRCASGWWRSLGTSSTRRDWVRDGSKRCY